MVSQPHISKPFSRPWEEDDISIHREIHANLTKFEDKENHLLRTAHLEIGKIFKAVVDLHVSLLKNGMRKSLI